MRFLVVAVGKPRDAALHAAITEYETRAARYWPLAAHAVREEPARSATSAQVREREGERLMDKLPPGCRVVCCDPAGDAMSSEQFAQWLVEAREAARDLAFVIGGAFGLSSDLLQRSELRHRLNRRSTLTLRAILAAPEGSGRPESVDSLRRVASANGIGGRTDLKLDQPVNTQYLVVWLTSLPSAEGGYRGRVAEIVVRS